MPPYGDTVSAPPAGRMRDPEGKEPWEAPTPHSLTGRGRQGMTWDLEMGGRHSPAPQEAKQLSQAAARGRERANKAAPLPPPTQAQTGERGGERPPIAGGGLEDQPADSGEQEDAPPAPCAGRGRGERSPGPRIGAERQEGGITPSGS